MNCKPCRPDSEYRSNRKVPGNYEEHRQRLHLRQFRETTYKMQNLTAEYSNQNHLDCILFICHLQYTSCGPSYLWRAEQRDLTLRTYSTHWRIHEFETMTKALHTDALTVSQRSRVVTASTALREQAQVCPVDASKFLNEKRRQVEWEAAVY
jgi:hypothetical protein